MEKEIETIAKLIYETEQEAKKDISCAGPSKVPYKQLPFHRKIHYEGKAKLWAIVRFKHNEGSANY